HQITAAHRAKVSRTDTRLSPWTRRYPAISGEPIIAWTASGSGSTVTCSSDSTSTARAPRSCRPRAGAAAAALPPGAAGTEAGGSEARGREADGRDAAGCEADGWAAPDGRGASGLECTTEDSSGQGRDLDMTPRHRPAEVAAARPSVAR